MISVKPWLLLLILLSIVLANASDKPTIADGAALARKALDRTNILQLSSFELSASIATSDHMQGTYSLRWNGPDQWREEIHLADFTQTTVGGKGQIWQQRSADRPPEAVYYLRPMFGFGGSRNASFTTGVKPDETIRSIREHKVKGAKAWCLELVTPRKMSRNLCVNESMEVVAREHPFEDTDFIAVDSKQYPKLISWKEDDFNLAVRADVQTIDTHPHFAPSTFDPLNLPSHAGCFDPAPPILISKVQPGYPSEDRVNGKEGRVAIAISLGADGNPKSGRLLASPTPSLAQATAKAAVQWRYEPALCGDIPVEQEIIIETRYSLERR